jgi:D-alanyl-D-alanine carboxypeptidase (penicillin-binding protein 5/6)
MKPSAIYRPILLAMTLLIHYSSVANTNTEHLHSKPTPIETTQALPNLNVTGYSLVNLSSNTLLAQYNADEKMPPASLTKLMTLFIVYDYLDKGLIRSDEPVYISRKAWRSEGSRMFVEPDSEVNVGQLIRGVSIVSGNDASVALAEHISGTEEKFVELMNQKAKALGLNNTHFANSTGLPHKDHFSSPQDMNMIGTELIKQHPQVLTHTKEKTMTYNKITQDNRNKLLWKDASIFGLKTGHTKEAGYCLVAAAERDNQIMIATLFGARSEQQRDAVMTKLFNHAQHRFKNITIKQDNKIPELRVWYGNQSYLQPKLKAPIQLSIPNNQQGMIRTRYQTISTIKAPIKADQVIGEYTVYINDVATIKTPLVAGKSVSKQPLWLQPFEWVTFQANQIMKILS